MGILASFFCFRKKLLLEMLKNMFTAPNDEYTNKMYFFINNFTKACFVWVYSAPDAPNKWHNRVHYVPYFKNFDLRSQFTDCMSGICEHMLTSLGMVHYLINS